jgi:hypothetical protein
MLSDAATRFTAVIVLTLLTAALVFQIGRLRHQMGVNLAQLPIYLFNLMITRVRWRARVEGKIDLPRGQPALSLLADGRDAVAVHESLRARSADVRAELGL